MAPRYPQVALVIHLDANFLIALVRSEEMAAMLRPQAGGESISVSAVAWSEFLCGPLAAGEASEGRSAIDDIEPVGELDAQVAADLFNRTGRRPRSLRDCLIAAAAIRCAAPLATLDRADFQRFEKFGLELM